MKVVILAGGLGTRISEESHLRPKPLIEIGGKPILWHIMKIFSTYNLNEFIICCGYKQNLIKQYFKDYFINNSDLKIDLKNNKVVILNKPKEKWKLTLVNTGLNTNTGGRLLRIKKFIKPGENFCFTYGDGVAKIDIKKLIQFHKNNKKMATLTAVKPSGRYGIINLSSKNLVNKFVEKPSGDNNWINGGFFVLNYKVFKFLKNDKDIWEQGPLQRISKLKNLSAYKLNSFWKAMDTKNDREYLENLWQNNSAPWKIWYD